MVSVSGSTAEKDGNQARKVDFQNQVSVGIERAEEARRVLSPSSQNKSSFPLSVQELDRSQVKPQAEQPPFSAYWEAQCSFFHGEIPETRGGDSASACLWTLCPQRQSCVRWLPTHSFLAQQFLAAKQLGKGKMLAGGPYQASKLLKAQWGTHGRGKESRWSQLT